MGFFVVLWLAIRPFLFTSKAQRPPVGSVSTGGVGSEDLDLRSIGDIAAGGSTGRARVGSQCRPPGQGPAGVLSWDAYCHRVGRNITPCGLVLRPPLVARTMRSSAGPQGGPQS
jgi:hypothetical protein